MRISVLEGDCGRVINPGVERYEVLLNGEKVSHCFTADEENGLVICARLDPDGRMLTENGEVARQELHGVVVVRRIQ